MFSDGTYCPTNSAYGRIRITVRDYWYNWGAPQRPETQFTFDIPHLAILYPSHRFRTEGGPYGYGDQTVSQGSLSCLVGWTPPGDHPNPALYWDCSWGTIPTPYQNPTAYVAGSVPPGEKVTPTIRVFVDAEQRTRNVEVFGDHLKRDMQNFMGGTNTRPLIWWEHVSNCHGTSHHAYDGGGQLIENPFSCPWGENGTYVYDALAGIDYLSTTSFSRGDVLHLDSPWSHSVTVVEGGSGDQVTCWMCNGPAGGVFQTATIAQLLAYGHRRIKWYAKP